MWNCHKCGKPVYFAERKQSLGYDWHPECLRCEECGKRLNPGQHAEHKGVPYCHVPCYGALFGPQLFGHGTRVESHTSFGKVENRSGGPNLPRSHIESKLKVFNQYYDGKSGEIRSREVNGRLVLEGALRIHWGIQSMIHLKEDDDQRTVVTIRKRNSYRCDTVNGVDCDFCDSDIGTDENTECAAAQPQVMETDCCENNVDCPSLSETDFKQKALTLPPKLDVKQIDWDELDDLLQVERKVDEADKLYQTMPVSLPSISTQCSDSSPVVSSLSTQSSFDDSDKLSSDDVFKSQSKENICDKMCLERNRGSLGNINQVSGSENDSLGGMGENPRIDKNLNRSWSGPDCLERQYMDKSTKSCSKESLVTYEERERSESELSCRRAVKSGASAIRRRPGKKLSRTKLKRRCSINGHFYNRETSFFTPPHGSLMSVWVTSLVNTQEVINLLLEKYKVDSKPDNFALFVVRDNGEQRRLREDEYPLLVRVMLGPYEDVAKLFLMDRQNTQEISNEVAQFLNLSSAECLAIIERYREEEERELKRIRNKYRELHKRIKDRMDELKVRL